MCHWCKAPTVMPHVSGADKDCQRHLPHLQMLQQLPHKRRMHVWIRCHQPIVPYWSLHRPAPRCRLAGEHSAFAQHTPLSSRRARQQSLESLLPVDRRQIPGVVDGSVRSASGDECCILSAPHFARRCPLLRQLLERALTKDSKLVWTIANCRSTISFQSRYLTFTGEPLVL